MAPPENPVSSKPTFVEDIDNGEELPLYENLQPTPLGFLVIPGAEATPDEVRNFVAQLLIEKRGLSVEDTRSVASRWTRGSGQDLIDHPPGMYLEIFGHEDGYMVYKELHLFHRQNERDRRKQFSPYPFLVVLVLVGLIPLTILTSRAGPTLKTIATIPGLTILVIIFHVIKAQWFPGNLEDEIHQELRSCMQNRTQE